jgi:hypothetical protein
MGPASFVDWHNAEVNESEADHERNNGNPHIALLHSLNYEEDALA